jgi:hypothetical protein
VIGTEEVNSLMETNEVSEIGANRGEAVDEVKGMNEVDSFSVLSSVSGAYAEKVVSQLNGYHHE